MSSDATDRPIVVLVVDDFADARELYAEWFAFKHYEVMTAATGEEAIRRARAQHPDIILMDLRMPSLSGLDTLRALRRTPDLASVPVVAFTAHALDEERRKALADGFDAFIAKPCLPDDLIHEVERVLMNRMRER